MTNLRGKRSPLPCGCTHDTERWLALCRTHGHYRAHDVPVPCAQVPAPECSNHGPENAAASADAWLNE